MSRSLVITLAASLTIIATTSCRDTSAPSPTRFLNRRPHAYMDLCWPIGGDCQHRDITQNENNLIVTQALGINRQAHVLCAAISDQTFADINNNRIWIWTEGPPQYDPDNYRGDRHNAAPLTHLTAQAFVNDEILQRTLIHESAHAIGYTNDGDVAMLEELCLGGT